jgi:peptidoglycan/xylan/chitin deacetylase (PgdA/CDA1 family)
LGSRSVAALLAAVILAACGGASAPPLAPASTYQPATGPVTPPPSETPLPPPPAPSATPAHLSRPAGEVVRGNAERPEMALTFDCGASGAPTPAILAALRAAGVRATFFITGQWATNHPELTRRIAAEHELANHSWSHPDFRDLSDAQVLSEMERAEEALLRIAGRTTRPLWRAPFGSRDTRILALVRDAGWPYHVFWTADSGDWLDIPPTEVRSRVGSAAANGAIIVQHCGSAQTAQVLGEIIADLQGRGFRLVTVSELLRD